MAIDTSRLGPQEPLPGDDELIKEKPEPFAESNQKFIRAREMLRACQAIEVAMSLLVYSETEVIEQHSLQEIFAVLKPRAAAVLSDAIKIGVSGEHLAWVAEAIVEKVTRDLEALEEGTT